MKKREVAATEIFDRGPILAIPLLEPPELQAGLTTAAGGIHTVLLLPLTTSPSPLERFDELFSQSY